VEARACIIMYFLVLYYFSDYLDLYVILTDHESVALVIVLSS